MSDCPDCFKDQRSRNDILKQVTEDAKRYSKENRCKVAITQEGSGFKYESFTGAVPAGTINIIIEGK